MALDVAEQHSLSTVLPPELLARLVAAGICTADQALAAVARITDCGARASAVTALVPFLAERRRARVISDAFAAAQATHEGWEKARALSALAAYLGPTEVQPGLQLAANIADVGARVMALAAFVPHLPGDWRPRLVTHIIPQLRGLWGVPLIEAALPLAPYLPSEERQLLATAFSSAAHLYHPGPSSEARRLASFLDDEQLAEILASTRDVDDPLARGVTLAALAPHLPGGQRLSVIADAVGALADVPPWQRSVAIASLVPQVPEDQRAPMVAEACTAARATSDSYCRAIAFAALAPVLSDPERVSALEAGLEAVRTIRDPGRWTHAVGLLAHQLALHQLPKAVAAANGISTDGRAAAITHLAPHLGVDQRATAVSQALDSVRVVIQPEDRATLLRQLARDVPVEQRPSVIMAAYDAAKLIAGATERRFAFSEIAPDLPPTERDDALAEEARAARMSLDERRTLLSALPNISFHGDAVGDEFDALSVEKARSNPEEWAAAVGQLDPALAAAARDAALTAGCALARPAERAAALTGLAPYMLGEHRTKALTIARSAAMETESVIQRAEILTQLAPLLADEERDDVLADARAAATQIVHVGMRVMALTSIIPNLPCEARPAALAEVLAYVPQLRDAGGGDIGFLAVGTSTRRRAKYQGAGARRGQPNRGPDDAVRRAHRCREEAPARPDSAGRGDRGWHRATSHAMPCARDAWSEAAGCHTP